MVNSDPMTHVRTGRLLIGLVAACWSLAAFGSLDATVDHTQVTELDLITLTVRLTNEEANGPPDFSGIDNDFDVVGQSGPNRSSEFTFINGRQNSETHTDWTLTLRPKHTGKLTIPPIALGNEKTNPIAIDVTRGDTSAASNANRLVFFETSVDTNATYVQGQVIYTVKLYYVNSISGDFPAPPDIDDAVVETVEKERRYQSIVGNRRFYVLEKSYAIYPQKSGKLVIPRETFSGLRGGGSFFSFAQTEPVNAVSEPHTIIVKPKPAAFTGGQWLPAKSLTITESWGGGKGAPKLQVGEPVNRILTMTAKGVASSLLPPFPALSLDNAKTYADPPDTTDQPNASDGIVSTESTTVGIVPTSPGKLTLPEIRVPWWNTKTDKMEVAVIPAETYTIAPAAPGASVSVPAAPPTPTPQTAAPIAPTQQTSYIPSRLWMYVLAAIALLWLATIWLWLGTRRRLTDLLRRMEEAPAPQAPGLTERDAWETFERACKAGNASRARNALFVWAKLRDPRLNSLRDLTDDVLAAEVDRLDDALYAPGAAQTWQGNTLLAAATTLRTTKPTPPPKTTLAPTLNPV